MVGLVPEEEHAGLRVRVVPDHALVAALDVEGDAVEADFLVGFQVLFTYAYAYATEAARLELQFGQGEELPQRRSRDNLEDPIGIGRQWRRTVAHDVLRKTFPC